MEEIGIAANYPKWKGNKGDYDTRNWNAALDSKANQLRQVMANVDLELATAPLPDQARPSEYGPPMVRPPRITPEAMEAEFESDALFCEEIIGEIRAMLKVEEQSWEKLAEDYRELGKSQAAAVRSMLDRLNAMREMRKTLTATLAVR